MHHDKRLDAAWWALKIGLGVGAFAAGADKFFNLLAHWEKYLSPVAPQSSRQPQNSHARRGIN